MSVLVNGSSSIASTLIFGSGSSAPLCSPTVLNPPAVLDAAAVLEVPTVLDVAAVCNGGCSAGTAGGEGETGCDGDWVGTAGGGDEGGCKLGWGVGTAGGEGGADGGADKVGLTRGTRKKPVSDVIVIGSLRLDVADAACVCPDPRQRSFEWEEKRHRHTGRPLEIDGESVSADRVLCLFGPAGPLCASFAKAAFSGSIEHLLPKSNPAFSRSPFARSPFSSSCADAVGSTVVETVDCNLIASLSSWSSPCDRRASAVSWPLANRYGSSNQNVQPASLREFTPRRPPL